MPFPIAILVENVSIEDLGRSFLAKNMDDSYHERPIKVAFEIYKSEKGVAKLIQRSILSLENAESKFILSTYVTAKDQAQLVHFGDLLIVLFILGLWILVILIFIHRWGKIRMMLPYHPDQFKPVVTQAASDFNPNPTGTLTSDKDATSAARYAAEGFLQAKEGKLSVAGSFSSPLFERRASKYQLDRKRSISENFGLEMPRRRISTASHLSEAPAVSEGRLELRWRSTEDLSSETEA